MKETNNENTTLDVQLFGEILSGEWERHGLDQDTFSILMECASELQQDCWSSLMFDIDDLGLTIDGRLFCDFACWWPERKELARVLTELKAIYPLFINEEGETIYRAANAKPGILSLPNGEGTYHYIPERKIKNFKAYLMRKEEELLA